MMVVAVAHETIVSLQLTAVELIGHKLMLTEDLLNNPAQILSLAQRQFYLDNGFLCLPKLLDMQAVADLRATTAALIDSSRSVKESNESFDLGSTHNEKVPDVRRIRAVVDRHPLYWQVASNSIITDVAADLVGPDVKFHSAKLNVKRAGGGDVIKWHQDIQGWPHTNYSPVTIGIYLEDVDLQQGPLQAIPKSHNGPLHEQYAGTRWTGYIADDDLNDIDIESAVPMAGAAGTAVIVNCRTIHGSAPNLTQRDRPLLLFVYSAADAFSYTAPPTPTSHTGEIVRGQTARWAHHDPRPCPIPPDWAKTGYGSIFSAQTGEDNAQR